MISIVSFLIVISICVLAHEGGHYLAAKWRGVLVHEFSFGMGPVIWSRQRGETQWSLRAFPIGGFVNLEGENGDEPVEAGAIQAQTVDSSRSLMAKKPWERFVILSAGAFINLLMAWLLSVALLVGSGVLDVSRPAVGYVIDGTPAQAAGILPGDVIRSINGAVLEEWGDISKNLQSATDDEITIVLERGGEELQHTINIKAQEGRGRLLGIQPTYARYSLGKAMVCGLGFSWDMGREIIKGLWMTVTEQVKADVVGPVGIAVMAGDAFKMGTWPFLAFLGVINLHLGVLNLLPFPALDGGRLIFVLLEMVTRRKISQKWESYIHMAGFIILIGLIVLITGKDILTLFG